MKRKHLFGRLDRRRAGKLGRAELGRGRLIIAQSDRDHDGTLTNDEYLAPGERGFRAADPDRDSIVSRAEFKSRLERERAPRLTTFCPPARRETSAKIGRQRWMRTAGWMHGAGNGLADGH